MPITKKIKVLIIDDSIVVRRMLDRILSDDPEIEVVDTASDPYDAEGKIVKHKPDVLTLDIEMPKMDGLTFLKILMKKRPMAVVVMSSLSQEGSKYAMDALQSGAVDVLAKPYGPYSVGNVGTQLVSKVKAAAISRLKKTAAPIKKISHAEASQLATPAKSNPADTTNNRAPSATSGKQSALMQAHARNAKNVNVLALPNVRFNPRQLILLGASTGGTEALKDVLTLLPNNLPGIAVVQHIPPYFSKAFADRLNTICQFEVREAKDGDKLEPGVCLIAPGDYHMVVHWSGMGYRVSLKQGPMVWHQRPAVDILFKTGAECSGKMVSSALLTGMGKDGAEGLLTLKEKGADTFAQDEESCVVYGMPKAAAEIGAAKEIVPLDQMAKKLLESVVSKAK